MAIKEGQRPPSFEENQESQDQNANSPKANGKIIPLAPDFGRSAKVVGDWSSVPAHESPHEKNKRGELGKPLFNWYFNRTSVDALSRIAFPQSCADSRNVLQFHVSRAPKSKVNPEKPLGSDPKALTNHIKRVAEFLGAGVVGVAAVHPSMLYAGHEFFDDGSASGGRGDGSKDTPEATAAKYPYAICISTVWDHEMTQAHRHHIGDHAYHFTQGDMAVVYANLVSYIRELGYDAVQNKAQPMPVALAAGMGELGRNGLVITEKYGARVHLGDPILTNMPLIPGKPLDIGVADFCKVCKKCATTCPTNSISVEDEKVIHNGVEKYKINWEQCYRLRAHVMEFWEICLSCVTVCPYTKPRAWWHDLAVQTLKRTPGSLRFLTVRALKWLDDTFWGTVPRKRVKWVGYDTGVIPIKKKKGEAGETQNDANGTASHNGHGEPADPEGKIGYYYPLKENTRRFEIMKEREERAAKASK